MTQLEKARKEYLEQNDKMEEIRKAGREPTDQELDIFHHKWNMLERAGAHLSTLD